jgi:hypothetical protein
MKKIAVFAVCLGLIAGCTKTIRPENKAAYDNAVRAIAIANESIKAAQAVNAGVEMPETFNSAKSYLASAEDFLEKDNYQKSMEMALKASTQAKDSKEIPGIVAGLIAETEKGLQFAKDTGLDKLYGKKLKEVSDLLWDTRNNVRLKKYIIAKGMATQAQFEIRKAIDDVEKANSALTKAKTAIVEAKEAKADEFAPEDMKSAEEAKLAAEQEMNNGNFVKCAEIAEKARQLAKAAADKAKEAKK